VKKFLAVSLFFSVFSMTLVSCSQERQNEIREQFVESTSQGMTDVLASPSILNCANPVAMKADLKKQLLKFDILVTKEDLKKKNIAQTICKQAIQYVVPLVISSPIPESWECQNTILLDISDAIALRACSKL